MTRSFRFVSISLTAASLVAGCAVTRAQQPADRLAPEANPAVRAALSLPRSEPRHYLAAVFSLVDLRRPELAAAILSELRDLNLNEEQRAALVAEVGSHRMLQLARTAELAPAGAEFAESCMAAAATRARDPQRIERLVSQLRDPSAAARRSARVDLAAAGQPGAVAVLEALARETDPQERQALMAAAVQLDRAAVGPLLGMLATSDPALRNDVIRLLESLQISQARPLIAAYQAADPASAERAERLLIEAIERYQHGTPAFVPDENDQVAIWSLNKGQKLAFHHYSADEAQTNWMARMALELVKLRPGDRGYRQQALVLAFEAGVPWNRNLDEAVTNADPAALDVQEIVDAADVALLNSVLADALRQHRARAAAIAAQMLGERDDAVVLYVDSPQPAPLAEALVYPSRRVRFAALQAIMRLDPQTPFPGSSRVPETLGYFATSAGERRAVVAMPAAERATTLAGRLTGSGIEAEATNRGGPAVRLAQQSADLEIVLVDVDIDGPGIRDVLFALRTDSATGQVPIGLLATSERLDTARRLATEHSRVVPFPRPQSDEAVAKIVARLNELSGRDHVTPGERAAMTAHALDWLGMLLARERTFYDLRRQAPVVEAALYLPALSERSSAALALLGTPASQRALVDFASRMSLPIAARRQAAHAFAASVKRHGLLLSHDEILRQYDRYNASAAADADTQMTLGELLDTIESVRDRVSLQASEP